jgi:hypothetical protein
MMSEVHVVLSFECPFDPVIRGEAQIDLQPLFVSPPPPPPTFFIYTPKSPLTHKRPKFRTPFYLHRTHPLIFTYRWVKQKLILKIRKNRTFGAGPSRPPPETPLKGLLALLCTIFSLYE